MKLKVISYNKLEDCHECIDLETNTKHRVDLFTDGLSRKTKETNESIIKKIVYVNRLTPYIEIAMDVEVTDE